MNGRKKQFEENKGLFINYNLCDVEKLQLFINKYKDAIVGQELSAYRCYNDNGSGPEPLVLSFGKLSFIIQYYYFDELSIMVFDTEYLEKDPSLNILFRDIPESRNVCMFGPECLSYPFLGLTVEDISYKVIEEKYRLMERCRLSPVIFAPYSLQKRKSLGSPPLMAIYSRRIIPILELMGIVWTFPFFVCRKIICELSNDTSQFKILHTVAARQPVSIRKLMTTHVRNVAKVQLAFGRLNSLSNSSSVYVTLTVSSCFKFFMVKAV